MLNWPAPLVLLAAASCAVSISAPDRQDFFAPSIESARRNAPQIFNALHNAMRQFGSSLHHNGMSFFPAIIPSGTLLYHGRGTHEVPSELDWLSFDIEHAENFAFRWQRRRNPTEPPSPSRLRVDGQKAMSPPSRKDHVDQLGSLGASNAFMDDSDKDNGNEYVKRPGYLHIYQAVRPLNLLYIDGMAAGKTNLGTNDAEDYVLTGNKSRQGWDDMIRARDLCSLANEWQLDGFIRMEAGFEVIFCDFHNNGLHQLSASLRPPKSDEDDFDEFQWLQAASKRYHGIGSGRVLVDYSAMVSAFFYPVNLTNSNATFSEQPRLLGVPEAELAVIKEHVDRVVAWRLGSALSTIDWQGITDMVVARFVDRLQLMSSVDSLATMRLLVAHLLDTHIDYSEDSTDHRTSRERCIQHYIQHVVPGTPEDDFIYAGIQGTTRLICDALFRVLEVVSADSEDNEVLLKGAIIIVQQLMDQLRWSEWKECGPCQANEVCYIAMWPFGNFEDHYTPSCVNISASANRHSYWEAHRGE